MQLTEEFVQQLSPPPAGPDGKGGQVFYRDSQLTGFAVRISSGGTKSYILERRIRGKVKRITLGRCENMDFARARVRATKLIAEVERENKPRIVNAKIVEADISLLTAYYEYLASHHDLNELSRSDYQRSIDGPLKAWQVIPVKDLTTAMVIEKHTSWGQRHPARCNNAMRLLRAVLNHVRWHMRTVDHQAILTSNPVDVLSRRNLWYAINPYEHRLRHLTIEKLRTWWQASFSLKKESSRYYLQALLITGYPHNILSKISLEDVDQTDWTFNPAYTNETTMRLPLPDFLRQYIYRISHRGFPRSGYLFPGIKNEKPLTDPRTSMKRLEQLSGIKASEKILQRSFMHFAEQDPVGKDIINLLMSIYRNKQVQLSDKDRELISTVQEKFHTMITGGTGSPT